MNAYPRCQIIHFVLLVHRGVGAGVVLAPPGRVVLLVGHKVKEAAGTTQVTSEANYDFHDVAKRLFFCAYHDAHLSSAPMLLP